jgi:hypothetical protein
VFRDGATGFIFIRSLHVCNNNVLQKTLLLRTLSIVLTKSMEQNPPRESNSSSDSPKIYRIVCNPTAHCRVNKGLYPECSITLGFVQNLPKTASVPITIYRAKGYYSSNLQGFRSTGLIANKTVNISIALHRDAFALTFVAVEKQ